ncbi:MAG: penicillin-binding protein 2 [Acidobacteriota bacterium]
MFDLTPEESAPFERRLWVLQIALALLFGGVGLAYWRVQVVQGPTYEEEAEANRTRHVMLRAPRGVLLDRNGVLLVDNRPSYDAIVMREGLKHKDDEETTLRRAATILRLGPRELRRYHLQATTAPPFQPLTLKSDLNLAEITFLMSRQEELPGLAVSREPRRNYVGGELLSHALGYVGEVNERELHRDPVGLRSGDVVGRSGLEAAYNAELTGKHGEEVVVVDSHGRQHGGPLSRTDPLPGHTLLTNIDADLQRVAKAAFQDEGYNGAAVVLDPNNGEVLALVSEPSFDPNLFSVRIARGDWSRLQQDADHPLQNRAIQSRYPPGSTFKLLEAIAGLEEGILTPKSTRSCPGVITLYGRGFKCHKRGGHGGPDLRMAIQKSCNGYFYHVGNQLGIEKIAKWGALFGLGTPTGIDLPGENPGILPNDAWKRKTLGEKWYPGETISVAIGQGYVQLTPVQLAVFYAALANGGTVYRPHIVRQVLDLQGRVVKEIAPEVKSKVDLQPENVAFIHDALWSVVNEWGTARKAAIPGRDVCGNRHRAGARGVFRRRRRSSTKPSAIAWFAGFAPRDHPEIAFCIFVEHGGHGGVHFGSDREADPRDLLREAGQARQARCVRRPARSLRGPGRHDENP